MTSTSDFRKRKSIGRFYVDRFKIAIDIKTWAKSSQAFCNLGSWNFGSTGMGRRPHFFKPFFASRSSKRLAIPPEFCKHIAPYIHRRVLLRGPGGNTWSVKVERDECSGDVFFHGGWNQFVSDHGLKTGDFLVFEHSGSPNFTVLIFDPSFCEKAALRALPHDKSTVTESRLGPRISPRRTVTELEKARALESASSFLSKRPFAISVMRDFHVYCCYFLDLPRALVKHLPRKSMAMRLRVPSGEAWKVAYVYCEGRGGFSSGWGLFSAAHNLERDDVVVFELVRPLEFRVYIHRVVEE